MKIVKKTMIYIPFYLFVKNSPRSHQNSHIPLSIKQFQPELPETL